MKEIHSPDPAWPEIGTAFILFLLILSDGLSELPMIPFLEENDWPIFRIVFVAWVIFRFIDLLAGGPSRRRILRTEYRQMLRSINHRP